MTRGDEGWQLGCPGAGEGRVCQPGDRREGHDRRQRRMTDEQGDPDDADREADHGAAEGQVRARGSIEHCADDGPADRGSPRKGCNEV